MIFTKKPKNNEQLIINKNIFFFSITIEKIEYNRFEGFHNHAGCIFQH